MLIPWYYKAGLAAAAFVAIAGGSYWAGYSTASERAEARKTASELAQTKEVLNGFIADTKTINAAAGEHQGDVANLARRFTTLSKDLKDAIAASPLPTACPDLDAGRVSVLQAATEAANSAARGQPSPAVP